MKKLLYMVSVLAFIFLGSSQDAEIITNTNLPQSYAATITAKDLGTHLFVYSSDEYEGRDTGEPGQKKAIEYLKNFYISQGISSPLGDNDYYQEVPASYLNRFSRGRSLKILKMY